MLIHEEGYYIGNATNEDLRFRSSSGGIGTAIIQYLLSKPEFGTSMTFIYNKELKAYEPKLIYSFEEFNNCGSIYQDTDNISFIKKNLDKIKDGMIVTCMPCQVKPIKHLLDIHNINSFIVSLCCSGQTKIEGTWYFFKLLGVRKEDVINIRYRGYGWPSGVRIELKDGNIIKRDNWTYPWTIMHNSLLFRPKRCLSCSYKTVKEADISLADPWLKEYENDTIGHSIIIANTSKANSTIKELKRLNIIEYKVIDENTYIRSQKGTIQEKQSHMYRKKFNKVISSLSSSRLYMKIVMYHSLLMKVHCRVVLRILKKLCV